MKVIAIIPARYASSRFPGKPLALIAGKSLLQRTFENASKAKALEKIIIATDDIRIYDHALSFGAQAVMTSLDCPTGTDRVQEALQKEKSLFETDIVVNIQGDEPCLDIKAIDAIIATLQSDPVAVVATPITPFQSLEEAQKPSIKCVKSQNNDALYFSRALIPSGKNLGFHAAAVYYRHIGIYAYRTSFLPIYAKLPATPLQIAEDLEQLKILEWGYRIKVAVVETNNIDVNYPEDIQKVEQYLCKQNTSS